MIIPNNKAGSSSTIYRVRRGTKSSEMPPLPPNPPVPALSELDGPFQLAEYLSLKVRHDPHDVKGLVDVPSGDSSEGGKGPEKDVWIYEHLRRIPIDLTPLVNSLLTSCNRKSCAQMKADEWLYLCVAHGQSATEECCAIDYILHTLDSTTAMLNSTKNFPSRLSIPTASTSHFPSLFRRLSRIFSHAYYHHREAFQLAEAETSLYARFVGLCEKYELVGSTLLVIPREAVGSLGSQEVDEEEEKDSGEEEEESEDSEESEEGEDDEVDRGRESEVGGNKERRPHSLGRHPDPDVLPDLAKPTKPLSPAQPPIPRPESITSPERSIKTSPLAAKSPLPTTSTTSPPTSKSDSPLKTPAQIPKSLNSLWDPPTAQRVTNPDAGLTIGRGTLSRGKSPRGTMLWSSDSGGVPSIPTVTPVSASSISSLTTGPDEKMEFGAELTRSDSVQTAIHVGEENETSDVEEKVESVGADDDVTEVDVGADVGMDGGMEREILDRLAAEQAEEIEEVPKDEIEILEEEGKLPSPKASTSPTVPEILATTTLEIPDNTEGVVPEPAEETAEKPSIEVETIAVPSQKQTPPIPSIPTLLAPAVTPPSPLGKSEISTQAEPQLDSTLIPKSSESPDSPATTTELPPTTASLPSPAATSPLNTKTNISPGHHHKKPRNRGKKGRAGSAVGNQVRAVPSANGKGHENENENGDTTGPVEESEDTEEDVETEQKATVDEEVSP